MKTEIMAKAGNNANAIADAVAVICSLPNAQCKK
jgi:hypothetical protein